VTCYQRCHCVNFNSRPNFLQLNNAINLPTLYNTRCTVIVELTRLGAAQSNDVFSTFQLLLLLLLLQVLAVAVPLYGNVACDVTPAPQTTHDVDQCTSSRLNGRSRDAACDTARCIRLRVVLGVLAAATTYADTKLIQWRCYCWPLVMF